MLSDPPSSVTESINWMSLLLTFLITVLFPKFLHAQYSFTENNPVYQLDYHSQVGQNLVIFKIIIDNS